jgi:LL-diaminopimelate aminotransferase
VLFLNYPNNPTGAVLEPGDDLFGQAVSFGRRTGTWIVHDQSYSETTFDGYRAPSFLETPGAGEVGVELFSLSKAYNMTGFRCAAAVGNAELIETLWRLKTNIDTGMSDFVQIAAAEALTGSQQHVEEMCTLYAHRRDLLVGALRDIGLNAVAPKATIYVWVPVPAGHTDASFADLVLDQAGVAITPGSAYGRMGEGFVRMSLTTPDDLLHEAVDRICRSLSL